MVRVEIECEAKTKRNAIVGLLRIQASFLTCSTANQTMKKFKVMGK